MGCHSISEFCVSRLIIVFNGFACNSWVPTHVCPLVRFKNWKMSKGFHPQMASTIFVQLYHAARWSQFSCSIDQIRRISVENIASIVNQWSFKNEGILKSVDISDNVLLFFEIHRLFLYTIMGFGGDFWGYAIPQKHVFWIHEAQLWNPPKPTNHLFVGHPRSLHGRQLFNSTDELHFSLLAWKSEGSSVDGWDSLTWWWIFVFCIQEDKDWLDIYKKSG